ncbi:uncharacterized protein LOC108166957 [Poecilia reticulata]|uniref:uncharacterized protein LOC108166957 n=1 Tax=Poecilia reticulata TaxID=8081 RepID=UPI0007E9D8D9|nr:PREDICTED: uncharacterized protein LOC108166957 [Poecilia reticulata]
MLLEPSFIMASTRCHQLEEPLASCWVQPVYTPAARLEGVDCGYKQQLLLFSSPECLLILVTNRSRERPSVIRSVLTPCCLPRQMIMPSPRCSRVFSPSRVLSESVSPLLWITYLLCPPSTLPARCHSSCVHLFPSSILLRWIPLGDVPGLETQARTQPEKRVLLNQSQAAPPTVNIPVRSPTNHTNLHSTQVFLTFLPSSKIEYQHDSSDFE